VWPIRKVISLRLLNLQIVFFKFIYNGQLKDVTCPSNKPTRVWEDEQKILYFPMGVCSRVTHRIVKQRLFFCLQHWLSIFYLQWKNTLAYFVSAERMEKCYIVRIPLPRHQNTYGLRLFVILRSNLRKPFSFLFENGLNRLFHLSLVDLHSLVRLGEVNSTLH
jgi:hypothetical protein